MATLGTNVLYCFDATQANYVHLRNTAGGLPGIAPPKAGDVLPALVVADLGGGVNDLVVQLRGPGRHFVQSVPSGTAGQQGRYSAVV
jgi:hypothetical protein